MRRLVSLRSTSTCKVQRSNTHLTHCFACCRSVLRGYLVVAGVVTMIVLGKQAMGATSLSKSGVYEHGMGASTLGIAFPRDNIQSVVSFLSAGKELRIPVSDKPGNKGTKSIPLDVLLRDFHSDPASDGRKQYIVIPTLLEHTGVYSSSGAKNKLRDKVSEEEFYRKYMKLSAKFEVSQGLASGPP